jgi:hypothetical protein
MRRKLEFPMKQFILPITAFAISILMITCKDEKILVKKNQHLLNFRVSISPPLTPTPGIVNYFWLDANSSNGNTTSTSNFKWDGGERPYGSSTGPGNLETIHHPKKNRNQMEVKSGDLVFFRSKFYASHYNNCHKISIQVYSNDSLIKSYNGDCCTELSDNIRIK